MSRATPNTPKSLSVIPCCTASDGRAAPPSGFLWGACDALYGELLCVAGEFEIVDQGRVVEIKKVVIREEERTNRKPAVMEKRPPTR